MLTKRIIPCLDIKDGRTVKGVNFVELKDAGDPVALASAYSEQGADELVFLDISATIEARKTFHQMVKEVARAINIPFTVGGGISAVDDVYPLLRNGADKVSVNSAAVKNPQLIKDLVNNFGTQCITVAIDARKMDDEWVVHTHGGSRPTDKSLLEWAKQAEDLGAGEILFTSMNHDGTKLGFANHALHMLADNLQIPIIASGGAGTLEHFADAFIEGKADAALAASVFHFQQISLPDLKSFLHSKDIPIRLS